MRISFVVAALAVLTQAVTISENNNLVEDYEFAEGDGGLKQAQRAKRMLSKANTSTKFKQVKKPFSSIEQEIDDKIKRQRKRVEKAVRRVKALNKQADQGIADARAAVKKRAQAEAARTRAEKREDDAVQAVREATKLADEQKEAQRDARKAESKAVSAQREAAKSMRDSTRQLTKSRKAKNAAIKIGEDRQHLIDRTATKVAKITEGTEAAKDAQKSK